jgi:hypothetical protein
MDNTLGFSPVDSRSFDLRYSDKDGSERRDSTAGAGQPRILSIRHTQIVNSKTKKVEDQTSVRLEEQVPHSVTGELISQTFTLTGRFPQDASITDTLIQKNLTNLCLMFAKSTSPDQGLALGTEIFTNKLQ